MRHDIDRAAVHHRDLTPAARNLLAQLAETPGCSENEPVGVFIDTSDESAKVVVCFSIETGEFPGEAHLPIEEVEPVVITYNSVDDLGLEPPSNLIFSRDGFPNPNYHVNSWPPLNGYGIEPCLSGLRFPEFFSAVGVQGVISRARDWLTDAKTGNLLKDGWEPLPSVGSIYAFVDIDKVQESFSASENKFYLTAARAMEHAVHFYPENQYPSGTPVKEQSAWVKQLRKGGDSNFVCAIHINLTLDGANDIQFIGRGNTVADLAAELEQFSPGLFAEIRGWCAKSDLNAICRNNYEKQIILVVGLERPIAMMGSQHLSSGEGDAARIEVAAFLVQAPTEQDCLCNDARISRVNVFPIPNPDLFKHVSGEETPEHVCIIGCGALGSHVALAFARKGTSKFTLFDPDNLLSHNLARHTGTCADFGAFKVAATEREIRSLSLESVCDIAARPVTFDASNAEDLARVQTANLIIDCTANEASRRQLSKFRGAFAAPVVRMEMYDGGRIGTVCIQFPGDDAQPDLYDLGLLYVAQATKGPGPIRDWLNRERSGQRPSEEMTVGIGCSSFTTRLPGYVVSGLASTLIAATGKSIGEGKSLAYQSLDAAFLPSEGFRFVNETSTFVAAVPKSDWHVHVPTDLLRRIHTLRADCAGKETGGYLFGAYDYGLKRITIVEASHAPNAEKAGTTHYELPPLKDDGDGKAILRRTNYRLLLIGAWHSHPGASAIPSVKDLATKAEHVLADCGKGIPSAMIIIAENQFSIAFGLEQEIAVDVFPFEPA